jgi:hypothetical protein
MTILEQIINNQQAIIESLRKQLTDSQKQVTLLREFVSEWLDRQGTDENYMVQKAKEALAATNPTSTPTDT